MLAQLQTLSSTVDYALAYAAAGLAVLPIHSVDSAGRCSCGPRCTIPGKHPRTAHGVKDATTDRDTILQWWADWPDASVAIACGAVSNVIALDIDPRNGGMATWSELVNQHEYMPVTLSVTSGGGGVHLYFAYDPSVKNKSGKPDSAHPGIDIKSDSGYVVAPPSTHASGGKYTWSTPDSPIAVAPDWLLELISTKQATLGGIAGIVNGKDGWIVSALRSAGLLGKRLYNPDRYTTKCPWSDEHSNGYGGPNDSSAVVFLPTDDHTLGHFHCSHAHCSGRSVADLRKRLPLSALAAADAAYPAPNAVTQAIQSDDSNAWMAQLMRDPKTGKLKPNEHNVTLILTHDSDWAGALAYNQSSDRFFFANPPPFDTHRSGMFAENIIDSDMVSILIWFQANKLYMIDPGLECVTHCLEKVCRANVVNPVQTYLDSLAWDGVMRLDTFATDYLGADKAVPFYNLAFLRWMIAAVQRAYVPGCQCDSMIVLEGPQGVGKSRALLTLASDLWFCDDIGDPSNKDAADSLRGKWIIEIGELKWSKSTEETRKAFISRRVDHYRPAYGRKTIDVPRQCVFAATTNDMHWQTDVTGARRYWAIATTDIKLDAIAADRDMLWAEAVARYQSGERSYLTTDEAGQQVEVLNDRRDQDSWEQIVLAYASKNQTTIADIMHYALDMPYNRMSKPDTNRVASILRANGFSVVKRTKDGMRYWGKKEF